LLFVNQKAKFTSKIHYESCSFSIYKKRAAIAIAGKTRPTSGTKIEGRYKLIRKKLRPRFCFGKISCADMPRSLA
jgi:hypothetical protein